VDGNDTTKEGLVSFPPVRKRSVSFALLIRKLLSDLVNWRTFVRFLAKSLPLTGRNPCGKLFHELVHAFRLVTEKASNRPFYPNVFLRTAAAAKKKPEYDTEEEFFAILITNIFSSETGRPLRAGHDANEALPSDLSTNKGFLAVEEYARLVRQFCQDHSSVSQELRDVPSAFNPIKEVLIGQGFQYLLNER